MRVSVVLCTHSMEDYEHFQESAESVLDQAHDDVELIVVVDGTEDVHERAVDDYGDQDDVKLHLNDENVGLLECRNTGAEIATGDVVAFIDDDAVADEQWLDHLVAAYVDYDVIAAGGRMTAEWVAGKPWFLPAEFYWLVGVTHRGFAVGSGEVRNTFGSNLSFRRDIFLDLGGFDPAMGGRQGDANLQGGETELCARMRAEYGRGVYYVPDAEVAHKVFAYRTELTWLLNRAFWQGYSKRAMRVLTPDAGGEETAFLGRLISTFLPQHANRVVRRPSFTTVGQVFMLLVLTVTVGVGYLYGITRYR